MPPIRRESTVLTIRLPAAINRRLARGARRQRMTRSEAARAILGQALQGDADLDLAAEARRQSELASRSASNTKSLTFIDAAADLQGWK